MNRLGLMTATTILVTAGCATAPQQPSAVSGTTANRVVTATAWAKGSDAYAVGRIAAESLKLQLGGVEPHVVVLAECFEEKSDKAKAAKGVASVFGKDRIVGLATYGLYTREGVVERDGVGLLALGGNGISVRTAFVPKQNSVGLEQESVELKDALGAVGRKLADQLPVTDRSRLMIVMADTHSPKNQLLLDGIQSVVGTQFPVTGGSVNKNPGMNFIHWRGGLYADAAVALMIDGSISVAQSGAQAKDNQAVLDTAKQVASALRDQSSRQEHLFLAFDCTGRKGKLENMDDGLNALKEGFGTKRLDNGNLKTGIDPQIFGVWCAGEIGCAEDSPHPQQPIGRGWHLMGTLIGWGSRVPSGRSAIPIYPSPEPTLGQFR